MQTLDYHCEIIVPVAPNEALENIERVDAWWAKHLEGSAEKMNDIFIVTFGETFVTFKVVGKIPGRSEKWQVIDCHLHWLRDKTEWNDTVLIWECSPAGEETRIRFTHQGLVPQFECFDQCQKGWDEHVKTSLYKWLTEKKGMPV